MQSDSPRGSSQRGENFVEALSAYSRFHRAQHWSGTFGEFLRTVVPGNARQLSRTSHEYLWDMLNWFGKNAASQAGTTGGHLGNILVGERTAEGHRVGAARAAGDGDIADADVGQRLQGGLHRRRSSVVGDTRSGLT